MTNICTVVRGILKMCIWLCVDDNLLQKNECLNFSEWLHIHWIYSSSIMDALQKGLSWSWPYGSWIYDYLFNQCISPLMLRVQIPLRRGILDTTLCDIGLSMTCDRSVFSPVTSTNKTDHHKITELLLKVALNTITLTIHCKICIISFHFRNIFII